MAVAEIHIEPCDDDLATVTIGEVEILVEVAAIGDETALFYRAGERVAQVETAAKAVCLPTLVRRGVYYGESSTWTADDREGSR